MAAKKTKPNRGHKWVKWTPKIAETVLQQLRLHGQHYLAAKAAGVSYASVHARRDPESRWYDAAFAAAYADAYEEFKDSLEAEARRRAYEGWVERPVTDGEGNIVGEVRKYSDNLMSLLLKRHRKEFSERLQVDANANVNAVVANAELEALVADLDEEGLAALEVLRKQLLAAAAKRGDA